MGVGELMLFFSVIFIGQNICVESNNFFQSKKDIIINFVFLVSKSKLEHFALCTVSA